MVYTQQTYFTKVYVNNNNNNNNNDDDDNDDDDDDDDNDDDDDDDDDKLDFVNGHCPLFNWSLCTCPL